MGEKMKSLVGIALLGMSLVGQSALARVTPAALALEVVKTYLDVQVENEIRGVLPQHKAANHFVEFESRLGRGKYSEDHYGFADFAGTTEALVQIGASDTYHRVSCHVSATVQVVNFAKQMVPILEETTNEEQLLLTRRNVSCRVLH